MDVQPSEKKSETTIGSSIKPSIVLGILGITLLVLIAVFSFASNRSMRSNAQPSTNNASTAKGQLTLDPRYAQSVAHLSEEERKLWREHRGELIRYVLRYPSNFSLDDKGIYGALLFRTESLPAIDGKITPIESPKNFAYFHALPLQQGDGTMKSVSKDFDADWASLLNIKDTSKGISLSNSESFLGARRELDSLLQLKVGEKGSLYTRLEDTKLNTLSVQTYLSHTRIPGFPAETQEIRYIYETDTLTYLFGGFVGGKNLKETERITPEMLLKIFNTIIIQ